MTFMPSLKRTAGGEGGSITWKQKIKHPFPDKSTSVNEEDLTDQTLQRQRQEELQLLLESENKFKNLPFKIELDDLLNTLRAKITPSEEWVTSRLEKLKNFWSALPSQECTVEAIKKELIFPVSPLSRGWEEGFLQHCFKFIPPKQYLVLPQFTPSFHASEEKVVELAFEIPMECFQDKDNGNHRYFKKKILYLAWLAQNSKEKMEFCGENLLLTLYGRDKEEQKVLIRPFINKDTFRATRLAPSKSNISNFDGKNTAHYNAKMGIDATLTLRIAYLWTGVQSCHDLKDAFILMSLWLGYWDETLALLMVHLLMKGERIDKKEWRLKDHYSSYQLFRGFLEFLAEVDLKNNAILIGNVKTGKDDDELFSKQQFLEHYTVVITDPSGYYNLAFEWTEIFVKRLQVKAQQTLIVLKYQNDLDGGFGKIFSTAAVEESFDFTIKIKGCSYSLISNYRFEPKDEKADMSKTARFTSQLGHIFTKALGNRIQYLCINTIGDEIQVGLCVDGQNLARQIDLGPNAEDIKQGERYRELWGDKAELRRFKDGSIKESILWSTTSEFPMMSKLREIIEFLLKRHFSISSEKLSTIEASSFAQLSKRSKFSKAALLDSFTHLSKTLRQLSEDDIPLSVSSCVAASDVFYGSCLIEGKAAEVVIRFEQSPLWPNDPYLLSKLKQAFYVKLREALLSHQYEGWVGVDGETSWLDLRSKSNTHQIFRLKIHVGDVIPNEQKHTALMQALCTRFPALTETILLAKHWLSSHLLLRSVASSNGICEKLVERMCAYLFTSPVVWPAPGTGWMGLFRFLTLLAKHPWREQPLICTMDLTAAKIDLNQVKKNFEKERKRAQAFDHSAQVKENLLFIVTEGDLEGDWFIQPEPTHPNVIKRLILLAQAAHKNFWKVKVVKSLFKPALQEFDLLLHLCAPPVPSAETNMPLINYDPVAEYVQELEASLSSYMYVFYNMASRDKIAIIWKSLPSTTTTAVAATVTGKKGKKDSGKDVLIDDIVRLGGPLIKKVQLLHCFSCCTKCLPYSA